MLNTLLLTAATASDWNPEPGYTPDPNTVTPGVIGFAVMALIALAVFLLGWDLNRRIRRVQFREEAQQKIAAEVAANEAAQAAAGERPRPPKTDATTEPKASEHDQ